jgi:hypothetical protein
MLLNLMRDGSDCLAVLFCSGGSEERFGLGHDRAVVTRKLESGFMFNCEGLRGEVNVMRFE